MKLQNIQLSANDKYTFISNLATMFTAGIPILECIQSIAEGAKGSQKKLLDAVAADLTAGKHLYDAFTQFPRTFDIVTINILKASEEAGSLDTALKDLKDNIRKDQEFNDKIRSAMIYPAFIFVVFMAVLLMILVVVVPRISQVFSRLNVELPLPTRIMIFMSDILMRYAPFFIVGSVLLGMGVVFLYRRYKRELVNILFSMPYLRKLAKEIDLTRFTHSLYLLLSAGLPITVALELTEKTVIMKDVSRVITKAKESVQAGKKLSEGLKAEHGALPSIMIKIIEAGEKSGTLDKSMQDVSDYMDFQVSNTLKTLIALLEPLMLVMVGVMVGGMMLAIIAPIYGMIGDISAR